MISQNPLYYIYNLFKLEISKCIFVVVNIASGPTLIII